MLIDFRLQFVAIVAAAALTAKRCRNAGRPGRGTEPPPTRDRNAGRAGRGTEPPPTKDRNAGRAGRGTEPRPTKERWERVDESSRGSQTAARPGKSVAGRGEKTGSVSLERTRSIKRRRQWQTGSGVWRKLATDVEKRTRAVNQCHDAIVVAQKAVSELTTRVTGLHGRVKLADDAQKSIHDKLVATEIVLYDMKWSAFAEWAIWKTNGFNAWAEMPKGMNFSMRNSASVFQGKPAIPDWNRLEMLDRLPGIDTRTQFRLRSDRTEALPGSRSHRPSLCLNAWPWRSCLRPS